MIGLRSACQTNGLSIMRIVKQKLDANVATKKCVYRNLLLLISIAYFTASCAHYTSACHELASKNRWELSGMLKQAKRGTFERHLVLIESGNEISSRCRSFFIDSEDHSNLPQSALPKCKTVSGNSLKYCTVYSVDGKVENLAVSL